MSYLKQVIELLDKLTDKQRAIIVEILHNKFHLTYIEKE